MHRLVLIAILLAAAPALAQQNWMGALETMIQQNTTPEQQRKLQQGLVTATMLGCVQKQAGPKRTEAFYDEMQTVGKRAEALCKQRRAPEARTLVLDALEAKQGDPVLTAAQGCYDNQAAQIANLGDPQLSADIENYARWSRDPALARSEMTDYDICR